MKNWPWLALIAAIVVCLGLEWPALYGPFVFDDFPNLAALEKVGHPMHWRDLGVYLSQARDFPGRPLAMLSFLPQSAAWPGNPFPFKLVNLIIHLICAALVFALVHRLAESIARTIGEKRSFSPDVAAILTACAWLLHPMQMSTTMLVVQRMTELSALFTLGGLLIYVHSIQTPRNALHQACLMVTGLGVCTVLATLCKENGLLLPVYAWVISATLLREELARLQGGTRWLWRALVYAPIAFIAIYLASQLPAYSRMDAVRPYGLGERLLTESRILFDYLQQILLPRYGIYSIYHDGYTVSHGWLEPVSTLLAIVTLAMAIAVFILGRRRARVVSFAIGWFLGGQLLESTVVPLELYFEHRNYLPMIGPLFALSVLVARGVQKGALSRLLCGTMCAGWFIACLFATALTARTWGNPDTLSASWTTIDPMSTRASHFFAERLYTRGQYRQALEVIEASRQRHPASADVALTEAFLLCVNQRFDSAAYNHLVDALQAAPFDRGGFEDIGNLQDLVIAGKCPQTLNEASWTRLVDTLLANSNYAKNPIAAGTLHYQKHLQAVRLGQLAVAIGELDKVAEVDPDPEIARLQAKYLASAGLYSQAVEVLHNTDTSRLPLMRRLLVDDNAIDNEAIAELSAQQAAARPK